MALSNWKYLIFTCVIGFISSRAFSAPPVLNPPRRMPDRALQVSWSSEPGKVYRVESADTLTPLSNGKVYWTVRDERVISQGTQSVWLDAGTYDAFDRSYHPLFLDERYYRVVETGTISNTSVPVSFVGLTPGSTLGGEVDITVQATVTSGAFERMRLFIDGEEQESISSNPATFNINTTEFSNGDHSIYAVVEVIDGADTTPSNGNSVEGSNAVGLTAPVTVNFDNLIHEYTIAVPYFDVFDPQDFQIVFSKFKEPVEWTLQILDVDDNFVAGFQGSGSQFILSWDGYSPALGGYVYPGYFNYVLTAQPTSSASAAKIPHYRSSDRKMILNGGRGKPSFEIVNNNPGSPQSKKLLSTLKASPNISKLNASPGKLFASAGKGSAAAGAAEAQTSKDPKRKNPRGQIGTNGAAAAAAQGHHPAKGQGLPWYGPLNRATSVTGLFLTEMAKGSKKIPAMRSTFHLKNDELTLTRLIGTQQYPTSSNINASDSWFNRYANIGLLAGHTVEGRFNPYQTQAQYPLYKTGDAGYTMVPYVLMQFGKNTGNSAPLLWMGAFSCNNMTETRFAEVYDKGLTPAHPLLNLFLGTGSTVYIYPTFGDLWAKGMNGKLTGTVLSIAEAWHEAGKRAHQAWGGTAGSTISGPVVMTVMYWNATQEGGGNTLQDRLDNYTADRSTGRSFENLHLDKRTVYTP